MTVANGYEQYKQQGVMTASPGDLVLMLYDGAIKQLRIAKYAMEEKNFENSNNALIKAQYIVQELITSLDLKYEISTSLFEMYEFINHELIEINIKKEEKRIDDISALLLDLRNTWEKALQLNRVNVYSIGE